MKKHFLKYKKGSIFLAATFLVLIAVAFGLRLSKGEGAGRWVWDTIHYAPLATFLNTDAEFAVEVGNYYFNNENNGVYYLDKAEKYFIKAIKKDVKVPDAWHQLARISLLRGDYNRALYYINKQLFYQGNKLMSAYYMRGLIYGYGGAYDEAEKNFIAFLKWDQKNWAAHNDLAWVYFQKGEYEKSRLVAVHGRGFLFK